MMAFMLLCLSVCLFTTAQLVASPNDNHNLIFILTGMCGFFLYGPYSMTSGCLALDIAGARAAGTFTGCIDCIGYFGGALAAFSAGWISDSLGWGEVFYLLTAVAFISTLCCVLMSSLSTSGVKESQRKLKPSKLAS